VRARVFHGEFRAVISMDAEEEVVSHRALLVLVQLALPPHISVLVPAYTPLVLRALAVLKEKREKGNTETFPKEMR